MRIPSFSPGYFVLLLLILAIFACKKDTLPETGYFSALSYNVAGLPEGISSSHPALYMSHISPLLNEFDVVHVQEDFCYHDSLLLYNQHPYRTDPAPCVPNGDGLNTFSYFPILNFERITWTHCYGPDCFTPKGFSYSQLEISEGVFVDFYNVHCDAGSSANDLAARRGNILQLNSYIQSHSANRAAIVMGDFNSRYTRAGDTVRTLFDLGFKDVWLQIVRNGDVPDYGSSLQECSVSESAYNCEGIDKVFYRSNSEVELIPLIFKRGNDKRFTYNGNDTLPLSDHVPVFTFFKYKLPN